MKSYPALLFAGLVVIELLGARVLPAAEKLRVYFGTYGHALNEGIFVAEMDPATGALSDLRLASPAVNPSFLAIHPGGRLMYAVSEVSNVGGEKTGGVIALSLDPKTGSLKRLNGQSSGGTGPCHLVVDKAGRNVLVANYDSGSIAVLPIGADGRLAPASSRIQHDGKGTNPERQEGPHAHSINLDSANNFAFVADLGLDKVFVYRFDPAKGRLTPNDPPAARIAGGSGPRHFAFHPSGQFAYVINEMGNTITCMRYDAAAGTLTEIETLSTLPRDFQGTSYTAEVVVHPSGKFVYGSNRGHDSIAIFSVDEKTGKLTARGYESTLGKNPRNFAIEPGENFLLAANQDTNNVVVFRIDPESGKLSHTGQNVTLPRPVCVRFLKQETP